MKKKYFKKKCYVLYTVHVVICLDQTNRCTLIINIIVFFIPTYMSVIKYHLQGVSKVISFVMSVSLFKTFSCQSQVHYTVPQIIADIMT
jgi:putative effector of murein hydrolase LrgA (UPF0299 family)